MPTLPRTITAALGTLNTLVAGGADYADAEWTASEAHKVSATKLRAAYDAQPSTKAADSLAKQVAAGTPFFAGKPEPKPVTPQVPALPGMTPLGLADASTPHLRDLTPGTFARLASGTWVCVRGFDAGRLKAQIDMVRKTDTYAIPGTCDARMLAAVEPPPAFILDLFFALQTRRQEERERKAQIKVGARVEFTNAGKVVVGTVVKVNAKSISVHADDGNDWRCTATGLSPTAVPAPVALPEHPTMARWSLGRVRYGLVGNEGRSWEQALMLDGKRVGHLRDDASGGPVDIDCRDRAHEAQLVANAKVWAAAVGEDADGEAFALWAEWTTNDRPLGKAYQTVGQRYGEG
jgi:hypothetical protein